MSETKLPRRESCRQSRRQSLRQLRLHRQISAQLGYLSPSDEKGEKETDSKVNFKSLLLECQPGPSDPRQPISRFYTARV
jgi:hypothetical protein